MSHRKKNLEKIVFCYVGILCTVRSIVSSQIDHNDVIFTKLFKVFISFFLLFFEGNVLQHLRCVSKLTFQLRYVQL